jgi:signal peptidase II
LRLEATGARASVSGNIIDYTGEMITIRTKADGPVRVYPAAQVVEVRTAQMEAHRIGLREFAQNRILEAKNAFERALQDESRTWVRRDILAMLVRCALRQGDYHTAAARFLVLVKSDPATLHFKLIPLVWAPLEVPADLKVEARAWLSQSNEVARLIGASVLFGVAEERGPAHTALNKLVTSADSRVRSLAAAQLWRLRLGAGELPRFEIDRFQARIEEMPQELRGGPSYLLGRTYSQQGDRERAVWAWLWVPLVYDHDHHLAARSSLEAADALSTMNRVPEATALYREVTTRFADTPFAREAEAALAALETAEK